MYFFTTSTKPYMFKQSIKNAPFWGQDKTIIPWSFLLWMGLEVHMYTATLLLVFGFDVDGLNTREKI